MGTVIKKDFNLIGEILSKTIQRKPWTGSTKRQSELSAQEHRGFIDGVCETLAQVANQMRVDAYTRYDDSGDRFYPALSGYDLSKWVKTILVRWETGEWKDESDEKFFHDVNIEFEAVILPDPVKEEIEKLRRDKVLAGILDPQPEDIEWLAAEREAFAAMTAPYDQAMKKLGTKAGFSPRALKDSPQA